MAQQGKPGEIGEHMPVIGSDGQPVGTVDHLDGDRIKLTRDGNGQHHWLPRAAVVSVSAGQVVLSMTAIEAKTTWQGESQPATGGPAGTPAMTGATQGQRSLLGAAEAGRAGGQQQGPHGQRQGGSEIGGMGGEGGANDVDGGTGMTRDPI
jgi:hypothetical protein